MAKRIKSGLKHLRKSAVRRAANASVKSRIKTFVRAASETPDAVRVAQKALDKAAARGVIHPNTAARRKSRMMRRVAAAKAG
ncbi:MAG: 30S ribosomal protein S20 [Armatimonadota bacterium]|nr:30S ribosomal protein S20 [Armatimonadota bacterium]